MHKTNIEFIKENIESFLYKNYKSATEYRNFYGLTFLGLALDEYDDVIEFMLSQYTVIPKEKDPYFHREFNNYALLTLLERKSTNNNIKRSINNSLSKMRFRNNNVTNWILLKNLCLIKNKTQVSESLINIKTRIKLYQEDSGLILDDKNNKSFQYHCFSTALLEETYQHTQDKDIYDSFLLGVKFIINFILPNGMSLYVGRGQEQIFGYSTLVYILEKAYIYTKDKTYKYYQELVLKYIKNFIRNDGSIPLVLSKNEKLIPKKTDVNNNKFLGWYNYNNYYDYLPFFLYYINKTLETYKHIDTQNTDTKYNYCDNQFLINENKNYIYFISTPGGSATNDIPFPLIFKKDLNTIITPFYGGEENGSTLYSNKSIPLPYGKPGIFSLIKILSIKEICYYIAGNILKKENFRYYFFRKELKYHLDKQMIIGENRYIKHTRDFFFEKEEIKISDQITFKTNIKFKYIKLGLFFLNKEGSKIKIKPSKDMKKDPNTYYNAVNKLEGYHYEKKNIGFKKGETFYLDYSLTLGK